VTEPTAEDLDRLLALQVLDDEVRRLEHQLAELPEQREVAELAAQVATLGEGEVELDERLQRGLRDQRQVEGEIDALTRRREEEQKRLYEGSLSTAREVQAAEAEIASTERRRSEHEDQLLEVMEVVEEATARVVELRDVRERLAARLAEAMTARDEAAQLLLVRIAEARVRRDPVATAMPPDLLARYERAAERGGGTGVGVLKGDACSACRITFPMSDINTFLTGPPLTECTQCRRLLVVPA
jgi:uncharacterized protein